MSYLLASAAEAGRTIQAEALVPWIRGQVQGVEDVVIIFGGLLAAIILVIAAFKAKGGLAGIVMGGITAFVLVWLMNNMGTQDKPAELIDDQIENNGAPALVGGHAGTDGDVA
ncbi:MAG: hypothetical protein ACRDO7_01415 [Nocardioidaceae bacterium]